MCIDAQFDHIQHGQKLDSTQLLLEAELLVLKPEATCPPELFQMEFSLRGLVCIILLSIVQLLVNWLSISLHRLYALLMQEELG